jgi:dTDP-4-amino-4,6-dideoxygalactose transaminase
MKLIPRLKPGFGFRETLAVLTPSFRSRIPDYEQAFARKFGCDYGTMFSHGRSGLYTLLKVWGLNNDEIICPAYTCVVVQHAVVLSGNVPVFVDCAENSFNMDYDDLEAAITEKTRAIVVTHLFGYAMDVHRVNAIVERAEDKFGHKIYVIQDAAHSYGTRFQGEMVTTFGDAAFFGSNISKIVSSIFGGMVITKDPNTHQKLQDYRSEHFTKSGGLKGLKRRLYYVSIRFAFNAYVYGFTNWLERRGFLDRFTKYYDEFKIEFPADWNEMPCNIEARVGLVQLERYDTLIRLRQENAKFYHEQFKDDQHIDFLPFDSESTYSHVVALVENREEWLETYRKKGIQLGILIEYSVPELAAYTKYKRGAYPRAAYYSSRTINFPNWPGLKPDV